MARLEFSSAAGTLRAHLDALLCKMLRVLAILVLALSGDESREMFNKQLREQNGTSRER